MLFVLGSLLSQTITITTVCFVLAESGQESLWKILLNIEKQTFFNSRLLMNASNAVLCAIVQLSEVLVLQYPTKINNELTAKYLHCLLFVCCHHNYAVRRSAQISVKKIVAGLGGFSLAQVMLKELTDLLEQQNWAEVCNFISESQFV